MAILDNLVSYIKPDSTSQQTQTPFGYLPSSGSLFGVPYNLDPTYSPFYQQNLQSSVNQAVSQKIWTDPKTKWFIGIGAGVVLAMMLASYKAGRSHS